MCTGSDKKRSTYIYDLKACHHAASLPPCRLLKRLRDEEGSRFQGQPLLHQRYLLLALLGRGGFSEVHKAYDLASLKFVAVKVSATRACSTCATACMQYV